MRLPRDVVIAEGKLIRYLLLRRAPNDTRHEHGLVF